MVSCHDTAIAYPALLKIEPQASHPMDASTPNCWKIGQGFMHLENMFLVRLYSVSKGSWQPEIWVRNPAPGVLPPIPVSWTITTSEDEVQLGRGQLRSPPSSTVSAPVPTTTVFTTLGGSRPNTQSAGLTPLNPQQHPGQIGYDMPICNVQSDVPVCFSPILVPNA